MKKVLLSVWRQLYEQAGSRFQVFALVLLVFCCVEMDLSAQVSGMIFQDFNANGTRQNTTAFFEPGQSGVVVNAYNAVGAPLTVTYTGGGSATNSTGEYSVPSATPGQVRLEFIMPDAYTFASRGNNGGTTVMFPTGSTQNLAVNYPKRFCQNSPNLVTPCFVNGRPPISANFDDVIVRFPYSASGTTNAVNNTYLAQAAEIGATWGMAYDRTSQYIYTSAFLKRHVGLRDNDADGKEDIGAIYRMTPSGSAAFWLDIAALGADVGLSVMPTIAARGLPNNNIAESNDAAAFPLVGKVGLGDIDISDDGKQLFVVSLYDKKVYTIDIATQTLVGSGIAVPNPCTGGEIRPFGLSYHKGKLYVGTICDAITSQATANLNATVYRLDGVTFTSVLSFPLNYPKGAAFNDGSSRFGTQWNPWRDVFYPMAGFYFSGQNNPCLPQPMLVNIEFDVNDDMIMLFNDRMGHQTGTLNWGTNPADNANYYSGVAAGDLLRASWNGSSYTLESNGMVGGLTGMSNNQGPGGGEFYWGDQSLNGGSFFYHEDNIGGGGTILAGTRNFAVHVADPIVAWSAGPFWLNNTNGQNDRSYQIFGETYNVLLFGKANGLGDLELMCDNAPIEIGNRVWTDTDNDGVQDPGEAGIGGIEVQLWKETTPGNFTQVATVTTDGNGNYYFSSASGASTTGITYDPDLQPDMNYQLRFPLTSGALNLSSKLNMGGADPNADARDTDASVAGVISFSTRSAGENDHTFDVAYAMCTPPSAITFSQTAPTCTGSTANNDGSITLTAVTNGTHFGVSTLNAVTYNGPITIAGATAISLPQLIQGSIPNTGGTYIVRVFNGADDCYTDETVTVAAVTCTCPEYCLFTTSYTQNLVLKFDGSVGGANVQTFGNAYINNTYDAAIGPDGMLYVASFSDSRIVKFNPVTGAYLGDFVTSGSGGLVNPTGITFGPDGNLYVSGTGSNAIHKYNGTTGASMGKFVDNVPAGFVPHQGLEFGPDGNLYSVNDFTTTLEKYNGTTGAHILTFTPASGRHSQDIAFGPDGNLYWVEQGYDKVSKWDPAAGTKISDFIPSVPSNLQLLTGATWGPDGNFYLAHYDGPGGISKFDPSGTYLGEFTAAIDGAKKVLFVCGACTAVSCTNPTATAPTTAAGTCTGGTPNNNATITVT
ncbi:MAG: hypothetical protein IAE84_04970, partial [Saprospiraceae bacterium]|nr:hypothetical protein [Saprospiraceae bacterium]